MTHTQSPPGNQSERNTSCVDSLISDKPDSQAEGDRYRESVRNYREGRRRR